MRRTFLTVLALAAFAAFTTTTQAQAAKFGVEAGGLYATLSGDDFDGTDAGMGFDIQGRYIASPKFSVGAGILRTTHGNNLSTEDIAVMGFFAEPRYHIAMSGSSMAPYLAARLGMLKQSLSSGGSDFEASGTIIGFGGGMAFSVSPTVSLGGSLTYNLVSFGDAEMDGTKIPDSNSSGSSLAVRFSVAFSFK